MRGDWRQKQSVHYDFLRDGREKEEVFAYLVEIVCDANMRKRHSVPYLYYTGGGKDALSHAYIWLLWTTV